MVNDPNFETLAKDIISMYTGNGEVGGHIGTGIVKDPQKGNQAFVSLTFTSQSEVLKSLDASQNKQEYLKNAIEKNLKENGVNFDHIEVKTDEKTKAISVNIVAKNTGNLQKDVNDLSADMDNKFYPKVEALNKDVTAKEAAAYKAVLESLAKAGVAQKTDADNFTVTNSNVQINAKELFTELAKQGASSPEQVNKLVSKVATAAGYSPAKLNELISEIDSKLK